MHCHIGRIGACHLPQFPQWKNTHQQLDIGYGIVRVNVIQHKLCTCKSIKSLHYIWYSAHILVTSAFHSSPKHWGHVIPTWLYTDGQFCVSEHQTVCLPPKWTMLKTKSVKVATINIIQRQTARGERVIGWSLCWHWGHVIPTWLYTDGKVNFVCQARQSAHTSSDMLTTQVKQCVKVATINTIHIDRPQGGKRNWLIICWL